MDGQFLQRLAAILDTHLEEEHFGVDELAREVGVSKSQLLRKLQALKNKSTSQFIREYRLQKAGELLQQQAGTASEIAYKVGFSSPTYFSSCFREYFGYPPGEAKFHEPGSLKWSGVEKGHSIEKVQMITTGKKRKPGMYVILGIGFLLATSFIIYQAAQSKIPGTTGNTTATSTEEKSIAVLPFANMSGDPNFEYLSDGMTDAVISRLAKIQSFRKVVPFTTMSAYKDTDKSIIEIASELGVTHLLEGNVQMAGDTVRIILRLIDGRADTYDWSDDYKVAWDSDELFRMQASVAQNVADKMDAAVTPEESASIRKEPTTSSEAYNLHLQAEYQRAKDNITGYENAVSLYQKAISLDPNYADAYIGLAYIWMARGLWRGISNERLAWGKAKELLQKAQQIDPSKKQIEHTLYAGYFYFDWDFELVEKYFQRYLPELDFGRVSWMGDYAIKTNRFEEALRISESFIQREPLVGKNYGQKVRALMRLQRPEEASTLLRDTDPLYNDNFHCLRNSASNHYDLGEFDQSRSQLNKLINGFKDRPPLILWIHTMLLAREGKQKESEKQLSEIIRLYEKGASGSPAWFIALYHCTHKDFDKGFIWLEKSYERHETELTNLLIVNELAPVRNDPRYRELYEKVGFSKVVPFKLQGK